MLEKTAVHPLLYRVVQAVCIFTAGSRELLGSRAVGKTWAPPLKAVPFFYFSLRSLSGIGLRAEGLDGRSFRVLERQAQLLRQRVHGRPAALPRTLGLETQVADAAAPRRDGAADGAEVGAIGVLLVEPLDDVRRDTDEGPERRRALDAVLPTVPGRAEDLRHLLQVIHVELLRFLAERLALLARPERIGGEQLLQLLRERRLRDAARADPEQLDLAVERRVLAIVQRADDVVRRREVLIAIQL